MCLPFCSLPFSLPLSLSVSFGACLCVQISYFAFVQLVIIMAGVSTLLISSPWHQNRHCNQGPSVSQLTLTHHTHVCMYESKNEQLRCSSSSGRHGMAWPAHGHTQAGRKGGREESHRETSKPTNHTVIAHTNHRPSDTQDTQKLGGKSPQYIRTIVGRHTTRHLSHAIFTSMQKLAGVIDTSV